jgi:hypothetical protein
MSSKCFLLFLSLVSFPVVINAHAVDQSMCYSGTNVEYHNNGSLKACELKADYEANGIRCRDRGRVSFYEDGNLESCILSDPTTIGENRCDQFGIVFFYPDGKLKSCMKPTN